MTGARGMVGQNILHHPAASGWDVLSPSSKELDLTDTNAVAEFMAVHKPDAIIHAAGRVGGIQANMANPIAFLDQNTMIGRNVILQAYKAGVSRLLNLASTCVYPRNARNPLTEDLILTGELEPTNEGYALAKILALRLCQYIRKEDDTAQYKTLIPCNLYGPYDKFDPKQSHLVPAIIAKMHDAKVLKRPSVEIWGDGTARREFMFAGDLADVALKAIDNIDGLPDLMNIGMGHDYSINEYYSAVADVIGWDGSFTHDLSKPVGMKQKLCSTARQIEWGWTAPTSLKDGLLKTYRHYKEHVLQ
ncbi:MAG: GDP-L-fucose synthase [Sulfitobacter sp.]